MKKLQFALSLVILLTLCNICWSKGPLSYSPKGGGTQVYRGNGSYAGKVVRANNTRLVYNNKGKLVARGEIYRNGRTFLYGPGGTVVGTYQGDSLASYLLGN